MADETVKVEDLKKLLDDKIASSPGAPVLGQVGTKVATIAAILLAAVLSLPAAGVTLPPLLLSLAGAAQGLLLALGIASPGVRKPQ